MSINYDPMSIHQSQSCLITWMMHIIIISDMWRKIDILSDVSSLCFETFLLWKWKQNGQERQENNNICIMAL